jgi:hypothetical protein
VTIVSLAVISTISRFANVEPFIYKSTPSTFTLPSFWTSVFGAPDESQSLTIDITQFIQDSLINYLQKDTLADIRSQPQSFYFDYGNQILYVHVGHKSSPESSNFQLGKSRGLCDKKAVYIDNIFFEPLVKSIPSLAQQQDIFNYDALAFINGTIEAMNESGIFDDVLTSPIFGNDVQIYYLEDHSNIDDYSFEDLIPIAGLYVENYSLSLKSFKIKVQDKRKALNVNIPIDTFTAVAYPNIVDDLAGTPIPLDYGTIRSQKAICTNGKLTSGVVTYRQALTLTSLGTVQVKINDVWTTKTPTVSSPSTGEFTLAAADGRNGTTPYECRVLGSVGIANAVASDIIKDLNYRALGIAFDASNYNLAEWAAESASLSSIGIAFEKTVTLFNAIKEVQSGANYGFRYEISPTGKRTIRIDNWNREVSRHIPKEHILDVDELETETLGDLLAAEIVIKYAKDYKENSYLTKSGKSQYDYVKDTYRQTPSVEIETSLTNATDAAARALYEATRYKDIVRSVSATIMGREFLDLRIYEVVTIELTPGFVNLDTSKISGTREWLGVWKVQIVSIDPDSMNLQNTVSMILIEKVI